MALTEHDIAFSVRRLATEFGMGRDTISKRLAQYGILSCGMRNGFPVYRLRDAAPALLSITSVDADGNPDPANLPPAARNAWFASELRRLEVEMTAKRLLPAAQCEFELAQLAKEFIQFLVTLPDQLEQNAGLTPEQVQQMHERIDQLREDLHRRLVADQEEAPAAKLGA